MLRSVIGLAQLDTYFRSGFIDENLATAHRDDVRDLRKLISLTDSIDFRAKTYCVLNPVFGEGSRLIQGADADLLIDGMLIDIKTTKYLEFSRDYFNQLLGYFAMSEIWGVDRVASKKKITKLAIYFARHASLQVFDVRQVIPKAGLSEFLNWFKEQVEQYRSRMRPG